MPKLFSPKSKELIKYLVSIGFKVTRQKGSHVRLNHPDGRATTVPVHGKKDDVPKGLMRKIIREDLKFTFEEFYSSYQAFKGKKK